MSEDILYHKRKINENLEYDDDIFNEALNQLEQLCFAFSGRKLNDFGLQTPNLQNTSKNRTRIFNEFDTEELNLYIAERKPMLNEDQKLIFDTIIQQLNKTEGQMYFIDAPGGTGKTFLLNLIIAEIQRQNKLVIAVASSGKLHLFH